MMEIVVVQEMNENRSVKENILFSGLLILKPRAGQEVAIWQYRREKFPSSVVISVEVLTGSLKCPVWWFVPSVERSAFRTGCARLVAPITAVRSCRSKPESKRRIRTAAGRPYFDFGGDVCEYCYLSCR